MAIEKAFFRQVMGRFATGVTVVTTSSEGQLGGITVNAFCSVSLNPPLVLICIDNNSNTLPLFRASKKFVVNMLTEKQEDLSQGFATNSAARYDHFCYASYHTAATGAPVLDDVLAFVDARIVAEYPGGDHTIFIGQVEAMGAEGRVTFVNDEGKEQSTLVDYEGVTPLEDPHPLIYYKGQYRHMAPQYQEPSISEQREEKIEEQPRSR